MMQWSIDPVFLDVHISVQDRGQGLNVFHIIFSSS